MKSTLQREMVKIKSNLEGIRKMERMPGVMFIIDTRREHIAVKEAKKLGIKTIAAKCPCCPHFTTASQVQSVPPGVGKAVFAGLVSHPAVCSQTEAGYRVSRSRSQHKRGPPVLIFS